MAETVMLREALVRHPLICEGQQVDALTGDEYILFTCPLCTFQQRRLPDGKIETMRDDAITEADAAEFAELDKTPVGRLEVSRRLRQAPGHSIMQIGSEDEWREVAKAHGGLAEFEAAVYRAIVAGEPLLSLSSAGGAKTSTWPKGTGPVK